MAIVVSGATGHLGRLVIEHLLARGVASSDIVGAGRAPEKPPTSLIARPTGVQKRDLDGARSPTAELTSRAQG